MGLPNEDDFYRTIMKRSWENYEHIQCNHARGYKVHDATQLISTLLIAVCYPIEREIGSVFKHLLIEDAEIHYGLPSLPRMNYTKRPQKVDGPFTEEDVIKYPDIISEDDLRREFNPRQYLGDYLEILRNAVAHGRIKYFARENGIDVDCIEFRNERGSGVNDCVEISISIIEDLIQTCMKIAEVRYSIINDLSSRSILKIRNGTEA